MMYASDYGGILFVEGLPPDTQLVGHIQVKLRGFFSQAQLKSLDDVKKALSKKVRREGGNSLVNFKYGQRSSMWSALLSRDDVSWYGAGDIAIMPLQEVSKLLAK